MLRPLVALGTKTSVVRVGVQVGGQRRPRLGEQLVAATAEELDRLALDLALRAAGTPRTPVVGRRRTSRG